MTPLFCRKKRYFSTTSISSFIGSLHSDEIILNFVLRFDDPKDFGKHDDVILGYLIKKILTNHIVSFGTFIV